MSNTPATAQSEQTPEVNEKLQGLKQTYAHLSFIHQKFLTTPFYLEEMKSADAAIKWVQELANKVVDEINLIEPPKIEDVKEEASANV